MSASLVRAAYRHLMLSGVPEELFDAGLLGGDEVSVKYHNASPGFRRWVFRTGPDGVPPREVTNEGRCSIVLFSYEDWSPPTRNHSTQFPRLNLTIYADPTRQVDNPEMPVRQDAEDKIEAVYNAIRPLFHDPANRIHRFDTLRVHSTVQGSGMSVMDVPGDSDGVMRGQCSFEVVVD